MPTAETYARFYVHPSLVEGKRGTSTAKFDDVIYAEIFIKGSTNTSFSRPKKDQDEIDFAGEWAAYTNNEDYVNNGTPLSSIPSLGPSMEMNLNNKGISTVEDLAGLSDAIVIGESGMVDLRQRAIAYLDALQPERVAERERERTAQQAIIEDLQRQVAELRDKPKRTRRKRNPDTGELE